jgi:uroporphyrinogen-III synthase
MKVLITRPRAQSGTFARSLAEAGFEPVFFPVIEIRPIEDNIALDRAIEKLRCYDWVVFTSVNGVDVFFERLRLASGQVGDEEIWSVFSTVKTAAIGPKTAAVLQGYGITPSFIPDEYLAEAILPGLGDLRGRWVLLPRAEIARKALPDAISAAGGIAHEIAVYQTLPTDPDPTGLAALKSGVDVITFTSSSTVDNFLAIVRRLGLDPIHLPGNPVAACIGPITRNTAQEQGLTNLIMAQDYTSEGLVKRLRQYLEEEQ